MAFLDRFFGRNYANPQPNGQQWSWNGQPAASTNGIAHQGRGLEPDSRARGMMRWLRDLWGGWVGPELSKDQPVQQAISEEKARAGPAGINLPWFLPYVDDVTGETAIIRREYRRMLKDPNVKAAVFGKIFGVASLELKVQPDGEGPKAKRVAEFVKNTVTRRIRGGTRKLCENIGIGNCVDGYSISEKVWKFETKGQWEGKYILRGLKAKDTIQDIVPLTDEFRNIVGLLGLRWNAGKVFSPANFLISSYLSMYEAPTGMSDFRAAYSRYWLLDTTLKLRAIGLDKRSAPILIGTYHTQQQKPSLEQALTNARTGSWLSIPEGVKVEALEIAGRSQDEFANAIKDLKHAIFLGMQFAILQALEGNVTGARSIGEVHQATANLAQWYLSQLVQDALNDEEFGLVPDLVDLNFVGAGYPYCTLSAVDLEKLKAESELDEKLHNIGLPLSRKRMYETYIREPPDDEADALPGAPPKAPSGGAGHPFGNPNAMEEGIAKQALLGGGTGVGISQPTSPHAESEDSAEPFRFAEEWQHYLNESVSCAVRRSWARTRPGQGPEATLQHAETRGGHVRANSGLSHPAINGVGPVEVGQAPIH